MLVLFAASAWLTQHPLTHQSLIHRPLAVSLQAGFPETLYPQVVVAEKALKEMQGQACPQGVYYLAIQRKECLRNS